MSKPSPALLRVAEILDDGEWHDYDTVVREVARICDPFEALRKYDARAAKREETRPRWRPSLTRAQRIAAGQRQMANDALGGRYFERQGKRTTGGVGATTRIRMVRVPPTVAYERAAGQRALADTLRQLRRAARNGDGERLARLIDPLDRAELAVIVAEFARRTAPLGAGQEKKAQSTSD